MTREIPVGKGRLVALVDDEDYETVAGYDWYVLRNHGNVYAQSKAPDEGKQITIYMHRLILDVERDNGSETDHINHNGLDNRRCNLRSCSHSENARNSRPRTGKDYKGVRSLRGRWGGFLNHKYLGAFLTPEGAALAYDQAATELYGEFARINGIDPQRAEQAEREAAERAAEATAKHRAFVTNLREMRQRRGISMMELSRRIGMDACQLSRIENGRQTLAPKWAPIIANVLGMAVPA